MEDVTWPKANQTLQTKKIAYLHPAHPTKKWASGNVMLKAFTGLDFDYRVFSKDKS